MIKLHIGAGKRDFGSDWIHIDGAKYPHIKYHDVTKLPFDDNSVDLIYNSHLIAYFDRTEILAVLAEWKRVLRPGGILRIATPDIAKLTWLYKETGELDLLLGPVYGKMDMGKDKIYHKTTYDLPSLTRVLNTIGFTEVKIYDFSKTEHAHIDDHSQAHYPHDPAAIESRDFSNHFLISLNVECRA